MFDCVSMCFCLVVSTKHVLGCEDLRGVLEGVFQKKRPVLVSARELSSFFSVLESMLHCASTAFLSVLQDNTDAQNMTRPVGVPNTSPPGRQDSPQGW